MKITAYILIISLVMLGLNRFMEVMNYSAPQAELASDIDCCHSDADCDDQKEEHSCPPGCDCNCCFQIMAIGYQFLTVSVLANQTIHYATCTNEYRFDYNTTVFQPPRLG